MTRNNDGRRPARWQVKKKPLPEEKGGKRGGARPKGSLLGLKYGPHLGIRLNQRRPVAGGRYHVELVGKCFCLELIAQFMTEDGKQSG